MSRHSGFPWRRATLLLAIPLIVASAGSCTSVGPAAGPNGVVCGCVPNNTALPADPDWANAARIGNADLDIEMTSDDVLAILRQRVSEKVSVVEIDSGLSDYRSDAEFASEVLFLKCAACLAHNEGLRTAAYYPSLEVITTDGQNAKSSMYKDHPDWLQQGIDGKANVFYGSQEFWVNATDESAWMSPNGPWRAVYLDRIRALAGAGLDTIWVDVPLFMDTGAPWPGVEPASAAEFNRWSVARGLGGDAGYQAPVAVDFADPVFRAWLRWRHENIQGFLQAIYDAALAVSPDIRIVAETFPMDYLDATDKGLDGLFRPDGDRFSRIWEVDSVSNALGMKYATPEDFTSKLAMFKWARAADRDRPSWVFSYGNEPLDAGLVMAGALATGNAPFELKTPEMTQTVGADFRRQWFGFMADHADVVPGGPRFARVGIWYGSASRDYQDYVPTEGSYGMYVSTTSAITDPEWWATEDGDSCMEKPHLGGWRGAADAMTQLRVPYRPIQSPGDPAGDLAGIQMLWMPSALALSDADIQVVRAFVQGGGILVADGVYPGQVDDLGNARALNPLADMLGPNVTPVAVGHVQRFGDGLAFYTPEDLSRKVFEGFEDVDIAAESLFGIERIVRIQMEDDIVLESPRWVHVEVARPSGTHHVLYVVNFQGLQLPLVTSVASLDLQYRPPAGWQVASASLSSPNTGAVVGPLTVETVVDGLYRLQASVDQFAVIDVTLEAAPAADAPAAYAGPVFKDSQRQDAAQQGLRFILDRMRNSSLAEPWRFGVWTNLIDSSTPTDQYAYGHLTTSEHMGLLLQAAACMGDTAAFDEAYRYVREAMLSPAFKVVNWAMDPAKKRPVIQQDVPGDPWRNGNAPLDDFRVVKGLLTGANLLGRTDAGTLAGQIFRGLYWTSVTDRGRGIPADFPAYPGGLIGYAWNFEEADDGSLTPKSVATGVGTLDDDLIPIDYQDLEAIALAARLDPRWNSVLGSATELLLASEIQIAGAPSGLFWNGLMLAGGNTGDFEDPESSKGKNLKTIQELWTALHLAAVAQMQPAGLTSDQIARADAAARRALAFFRTFHAAETRIPEYLTTAGVDVPACGTTFPVGCLEPDVENMTNGEARIYALVARLAARLGDATLAATMIEQHLLTDRDSNPSSNRFGFIGVSTANPNDAEAWDTLEAVVSLCEESNPWEAGQLAGR